MRQPSRPQTLSDENNLLEDFDFKVPTSSIGLTTFGYQRALKTRVNHDKLLQNGALDTHLYTPTFVHDILMLPGSLAQLIGKVFDHPRTFKNPHLHPSEETDPAPRSPKTTSSTA